MILYNENIHKAKITALSCLTQLLYIPDYECEVCDTFQFHHHLLLSSACQRFDALLMTHHIYGFIIFFYP